MDFIDFRIAAARAGVNALLNSLGDTHPTTIHALNNFGANVASIIRHQEAQA